MFALETPLATNCTDSIFDVKTAALLLGGWLGNDLRSGIRGRSHGVSRDFKRGAGAKKEFLKIILKNNKIFLA